jgi:hypothetical protein
MSRPHYLTTGVARHPVEDRERVPKIQELGVNETGIDGPSPTETLKGIRAEAGRLKEAKKPLGVSPPRAGSSNAILAILCGNE